MDLENFESYVFGTCTQNIYEKYKYEINNLIYIKQVD